MTRLAILLGATALTATVATAETIQLQLTYDNLQFRFTPDSNFSDEDVSGFLYPNDGAIYNDQISPADRAALEQAVDRELQEIFENDQTNGGATFVENDPATGELLNAWVLPQTANPFDSITFSLTLDTDDFLSTNVAGRSDVADDTEFRTYNTTITGTAFDASGAVVDTFKLFDILVTGANDDLFIGDGQTTDAVALGGFTDDATTFSEGSNIGFFFADLENNVNGGNWFDLLGTTATDADGNPVTITDNALAFALENSDLTRFFEYEDRLLGQSTDESGNVQTVQLGYFQVQGQFAGAVGSTGQEAAPFLPSDVELAEDGTPTYTFTVAVPQDLSAPIWIDPDVAVGYVYEVLDDNGNAVEIAGVEAPDFSDVPNPNDYTLTVFFDDGNGGEASIGGITLAPGDPLLFADYKDGNGDNILADERILRFILAGIDTGLMLDPSNPQVFQTGIFIGDIDPAYAGALNLTQKPIVEFVPDGDMNVSAVPLPMPALMLLSGLAGLGLMRRRKTA